MAIVLTKLSFQCALIQLLKKTVSLYRGKLECFCSYEKKLVVLQRMEVIPIRQAKDGGGIMYKSAIALKLAPVLQESAMYIATELAKYCREIVNTEGKKDVVNLHIDVIPSGIIYMKLTDLSIANWLSYLISFPFKDDRQKFQVNFNHQSCETINLFPIQYSHARCCSLLRMAESDGLITLVRTNPENYSQFWFIQTPNSIPWQKSNGKLQFLHHSEYELIGQIASTLDYIYCVSTTRKPINWVKVANSLNTAFQNFYCQCRIWGEVKVKTPKLAKARLGLVLVTQSLLRFLLEERLGGKAPIEL
ncbi:DALR anticodon-binding domain-containing protein [Okeania sp. SIO3I5]|uniref:DALR anticodon-binding domain-containing protein n=1 Tax=Okeania sp. SIO3I5 TaxID=2607805 RepID=UPI0025F8BF24|nr:DALR anticodon-binding domain-containing protein [Okeania sp. SIO3I5]